MNISAHSRLSNGHPGKAPRGSGSRRLRHVLLGLCAVAHALAAAPASAVYINAGMDWRERIVAEDPFLHLTSIDGDFVMIDLMGFGLNLGSGVNGGAYAFGETAPSGGVPEGMIRITTVYGIDLDPNSTVMHLTGFNAANPELTPLTNETITSRFGTHYASSAVQIVPLHALGGVLPGHDLSPFANGDPNSILYVFQVLAPANEFLKNTCYANCDGSSTSPALNVLDFACFLNRYAAGDPTANCDGSTTSPLLNVLDFACFLNKYAAGCT